MIEAHNVIDKNRIRKCPLCGEEVLTSRLTCPYCGGRIYTELVVQEGIEVQRETGKKWPFADPPEVKEDRPYVLCEKGSTKGNTHYKKVHIMVCAVKCNRIFKCENLQRALSEEGTEQFNSALKGIKASKKKKPSKREEKDSLRQRKFITLKKTDWRDIRKAVEEKLLNEYREARKMNPTSMAKKLDISLPSYQRLENGNAPRIQRQLMLWIEGKIAEQEKTSQCH